MFESFKVNRVLPQGFGGIHADEESQFGWMWLAFAVT